MPDNSIQELMQRLKNVEYEEIRRESEAYLEAVFKVNAMEEIGLILEEYYGPAFKRAGVKPGREASECTKKYGGMQEEQVLYFRSQEGVSQLAMIWPWQDGVRATVKIIQVL